MGERMAAAITSRFSPTVAQVRGPYVPNVNQGVNAAASRSGSTIVLTFTYADGSASALKNGAGTGIGGTVKGFCVGTNNAALQVDTVAGFTAAIGPAANQVTLTATTFNGGTWPANTYIAYGIGVPFWTPPTNFTGSLASGVLTVTTLQTGSFTASINSSGVLTQSTATTNLAVAGSLLTYTGSPGGATLQTQLTGLSGGGALTPTPTWQTNVGAQSSIAMTSTPNGITTGQIVKAQVLNTNLIWPVTITSAGTGPGGAGTYNVGAAKPWSAVGSISTTTMTITAITPGGCILPGDQVAGGGIADAPTVSKQLTGVPGGIGTYQLSASETVAGGTALNGFVPAQSVAGTTLAISVNEPLMSYLLYDNAANDANGNAKYQVSGKPGNPAESFYYIVAA
jgi:hypothetical protein